MDNARKLKIAIRNKCSEIDPFTESCDNCSIDSYCQADLNFARCSNYTFIHIEIVCNLLNSLPIVTDTFWQYYMEAKE